MELSAIRVLSSVDPLTISVVAIKKSQLHDCCLDRNRSAEISAYVTPPMKSTMTSFR